MDDRSLSALGFGDVPAEAPLTYPGRPVTAPRCSPAASCTPSTRRSWTAGSGTGTP
ncbi:hypothetical protein [Streptomyces sp. NPDC059850]|uniref:hypothetical protein n=1 Tax=Streptomyces sp. NPDC059850 TaxID=3346970 RepID=UPI003666A1C9